MRYIIPFFCVVYFLSPFIQVHVVYYVLTLDNFVLCRLFDFVRCITLNLVLLFESGSICSDFVTSFHIQYYKLPSAPLPVAKSVVTIVTIKILTTLDK